MSLVARRYAKALFELAREAGEVEGPGRELDALATAFDAHDVSGLLERVALEERARRTVASRLSARLGLSELLANFLAVVAANNRLREVGAIARAYRQLQDQVLGRVRAHLRSARPLTEESRRRIAEVFENQTGKRVIAEASVDPELLGGVVVEIAGRVFDGSLRTRLERLERSLAG
jgi:F-type H+-transporting ATPase subunit delta